MNQKKNCCHKFIEKFPYFVFALSYVLLFVYLIRHWCDSTLSFSYNYSLLGVFALLLLTPILLRFNKINIAGNELSKSNDDNIEDNKMLDAEIKEVEDIDVKNTISEIGLSCENKKDDDEKDLEFEALRKEVIKKYKSRYKSTSAHDVLDVEDLLVHDTIKVDITFIKRSIKYFLLVINEKCDLRHLYFEISMLYNGYANENVRIRIVYIGNSEEKFKKISSMFSNASANKIATFIFLDMQK